MGGVACSGQARGVRQPESAPVVSGTVVVGKAITGNPELLRVAGADLKKGMLFLAEDMVSRTTFEALSPAEILSSLNGSEVCSLDLPVPMEDPLSPFAAQLVVGKTLNAVTWRNDESLSDLLERTDFSETGFPPTVTAYKIDFHSKNDWTTDEGNYWFDLDITGTYDGGNPALALLVAAANFIAGKECPKGTATKVSCKVHVRIVCQGRKKREDGSTPGWSTENDLEFEAEDDIVKTVCDTLKALTPKGFKP